MRICLLGPITVSHAEGTTLPLPGKQSRTLLAVLALAEGHVVSTGKLIDALWPLHAPSDPANALQTQVSRLRKALGYRVRSHPHGYQLRDIDTDVAEFRRLVRHGQQLADRSPAEAERALDSALALWQGEPLADLRDSESLSGLITGLETERTDVQAQLIELAIANGHAADWLGQLASDVSARPLDERTVSQYMRALAATGQQAEALSLFDRTRNLLRDELGIDPSTLLTSMQREVLQGIETASSSASFVRPEPPVFEPALPLSLSSFVGRENDVKAVTGLLDHSRLVTLTGPGGAGKTRLATEIGRHIVDAGSLAVRMVELAPLNDPAQIPEVIYNSLHVVGHTKQTDSRDIHTRLRTVLADWPLLLILDNCEHVRIPAAQTVRTLLAHAPQLRVIATSRQPFYVPGEALHPVEPMPYPAPDQDVPASTIAQFPAVTLLVHRAQSFAPQFQLTDDNAQDVARICAAIDGLPLALELAAARLRTMSPADLANRLNDRFSLLTSGDSSAENRQRTLRAVVDWSWELLTAPEQTLLAQLSVFNGPTSLSSIEAVCQADPALLAELVDKSLVQLTGDGRYVQLEIIKEYAAEKLANEPGAVERMRRAHADHFADLAREASPHLTSAVQTEWLQTLAADHSNFVIGIYRMIDAGDIERAARLFAPLGWYWWMRGFRQEGLDLAEKLWDMAHDSSGGYRSDLDPQLLAEIAVAGTWGVWDGSRGPDEVLPKVDEGIRLAVEHDLADPIPIMRIYPLLRAAMVNDEPEIRRLADLYLQEDLPPWTRGMVLFQSAFLLTNDSMNMELVEQRIAEAIEIFEAEGERFGIIMATTSMAELRHQQGRIDEARTLYERSAQAEAELGGPRGDSVVGYLWLLRAEHDDPHQVLELVRSERRFAARVGNQENVLSTYVAEAMCLHRLGDDVTAKQILDETYRNLQKYKGISALQRIVLREMNRVADATQNETLAAFVRDELLPVDNPTPGEPRKS